MREKTESSVACNHHKVGFLGLLVTLGIVFGDIGTSPLYVMKAILHTGETINESTILGALSCIIWTLTLQTTIKYVCVALRADNNGEGGILALYALLRRLKSKWIYILAIIGASTLLADGIITPAITVTTAIEGLESISPNLPVIPITLAIITIIFFVQRFGTEKYGTQNQEPLWRSCQQYGCVIGVESLQYQWVRRDAECSHHTQQQEP